MPTPKTALLVILLTAVALAAACNWLPGSNADEPESAADRAPAWPYAPPTMPLDPARQPPGPRR